MMRLTTLLLLATLISCEDDDASSSDTATPETSTTAGVGDGAGRVALSNIRKVDADGNVEPVVTEDSSGNHQVDLDGAVAVGAIALEANLTASTGKVLRVYVSPSDTVYALFSEPLTFAEQGNCVLASITSAGVTACVDADLASITYEDIASNEAVQFSEDGAIYYFGAAADGSAILRRSDGEVSDIINDNIEVSDFRVLADGAVVVGGKTKSTETNWVKRFLPNGGLKNLVLDHSGTTLISTWNDDNTYIGVTGGDGSGIVRYLESEDQLDTRYWLTDEFGPDDDAYNVLKFDDCTSGGAVYSEMADKLFCRNGGSGAKSIYDQGEKVYGILEGLLFQLFPASSVANQFVSNNYIRLDSLPNVKVLSGSGNYLFLGGIDSALANKLISYDITSGEEQSLLEQDIEIYHIVPDSDGVRVFFDGLRYDDNKYVIGVIDVASLSVEVEESSGKLANLASF